MKMSKTFIEALTGKRKAEGEGDWDEAVPLTQTQPPQIEGGNITVTINEEEYAKGLAENRYNIIGCPSLLIGEESVTTLGLKKKLLHGDSLHSGSSRLVEVTSRFS